MKKTIYISDLDGTLLEPDATLSDETAQRLNALIRRGVAISAATARTWATVRYLLRDVALDRPVILMNGVCLFDPVSDRYLKIHPIPEDVLLRLLDVMAAEDVHGFLYRIRNNELISFYDQVANKPMQHFIEERQQKYHKLFVQCADLKQEASKDIVYLSMINTPEHLDPVYERIKDDPDLHIEYYKDIYDEGYWYLEVSAGGASKAAAVQWLKEYGGFDELVVFGDNMNDLTAFDETGVSYTVANARSEVQDSADIVMGSFQQDGVLTALKTILIAL